MDCSFIGQRITELRLKKGVSEYKMSYDLGHNKNYIRSITTGRALPSVNELFNIFEYLNVSPAQFFDRDYPQLIRKAVDYMEQLEDEDLIILLNIIQLFSQRCLKK